MKSIFKHSYIWILIAASGLFTGCSNFEKEVEIKVPPFKSQLVVESYVETGKPIKVAVSETQDIYGEFKLPFVNDATVTFTYNGRTDTLMPNPPDLTNLKFFNYILKDSFNFKPGDVAYITVRDKNGRMATAESRWQDPVMLDSVAQAYKQNDTMALITAHFTDPGGVSNKYRFRVVNLSDSAEVYQDIFTEDGILDGKSTAFGTGYRFRKGDKLEVTLYSMTDAFYEFLSTAVAASNANGNPFAQPAVIKSNVTGGTGIFTFLPFSRIIYTIK